MPVSRPARHITPMERNTRQRDAIRHVFESTPRPLGPGEVLDAAQRRVSGLGMATVYRTINALLEAEWLVAVELPGEAPRYERAGAGHHHHFRCSACARVFEIPGCPGDLRELTPPGFELERHDVTLYGRCARCVAA
ncbi:MAG TPA: transcriptional repressor [Gemmatimonas sp.]|nr:transcriptional repressor [Gemmatimonas sp.]